MTPEQAFDIVKTRGLVRESGGGTGTSIAEVIAGGPIRGSWWAHARGREIFAVTRALRNHPDVLVCRLVGGKITYVHRRLWPALVAMAARIPASVLAHIRERHTESGRHVTDEVPFPQWVPETVSIAAGELGEAAALAQLAAWAELIPTV